MAAVMPKARDQAVKIVLRLAGRVSP